MQQPEVLYQDTSVLALNKPAGWVVNDATTVGNTPTLQKWISENFDFETAKDFEYRSGIVHRLDKETSGIVLIAKTKESFHDLQSQFKERSIKKTYLALAHGKLKEKKGTITATVGRLPWRRDRFGVLPGGRDSETGYQVIEQYEKGKEIYSLVELYPKTGRTHQIRIHLKHIGHPIVGDHFYAGRKTSRNDRKWCPRLFLHAAKIVFRSTESKKLIDLESPLAEDLQAVLESLTKK